MSAPPIRGGGQGLTKDHYSSGHAHERDQIGHRRDPGDSGQFGEPEQRPERHGRGDDAKERDETPRTKVEVSDSRNVSRYQGCRDYHRGTGDELGRTRATAGISSAKRRVSAPPAPAEITAEENQDESEDRVVTLPASPWTSKPLPNNARTKPGTSPECILSPSIK